MKQKKEFVSPEMEVIEFASEDIMTAVSGGGSNNTNSEIELPDHDW